MMMPRIPHHTKIPNKNHRQAKNLNQTKRQRHVNLGLISVNEYGDVLWGWVGISQTYIVGPIMLIMMFACPTIMFLCFLLRQMGIFPFWRGRYQKVWGIWLWDMGCAWHKMAK